jgi:GNAT superfamily N-acetyltransferase
VEFQIRPASLDDRAGIERLIALSARELSKGDYSAEQIEGALCGAFGVDTQLILDASYFVIWAGDVIAGCGGWSRRRTLFGGDSRAQRDAGELDPAIDAARIRAFFIHPDFARRGLGRLLLQHCEDAARDRGFSRFELVATLPGVRLYAACGYIEEERLHYPVAPDVSIEFVRMTKRAAHALPTCSETQAR